MPEHGQLVIDTSGIQVVYYVREELTPGMRIAGGWRPWPVFESAEENPDEQGAWRMVFVGGHKGGWVSAGELIPVIAYDPLEDAG